MTLLTDFTVSEVALLDTSGH